jgi:MFS family permease
MNDAKPSKPSLTQVLALNRTVGIVLLTVLCFGLGEQLWSQFMPVYLHAQNKQLARESGAATAIPWAALWTIGVYACLRNFFEALCYIGGGQITARLGDRGSLILFAVLTMGGYVLFLASSTATLAVLAALLIMGWEPLSVPVTFTTVGATVANERRGMAFALQSIQKRLPKIIGPLLAGFVLGAAERAWHDRDAGHIAGMRILLLIALLLGAVSLLIQIRWMPRRKPAPPGPPAWTILRQFPPALRRLLVAEVFTRWCDWLVREYVVLYVVLLRGATIEEAGLLFALQNFTALLTYLPIGRLTQTVGLQPFIGLTFIFFALFPLVLALAPGQGGLLLAFVVYGLREIGEPARKATITALVPEPVRAQGVGLYWGVRSFTLCSASLVGAVVWYAFGPECLLYLAFALGCAGAAIFYLFYPRSALETAVATVA